EQARDLHRRWWGFAETNGAVDSDAACYERVSECTGRKARGVLDDVHVLAGAGAGSDRAVGLNRSVAQLSEAESRAAAGDRAHVRHERNGAGRWLELHGSRLARRGRCDRNRYKVLVERER